MAKRKKQDEDSDEDFDPSSVEMTVELSSLDNQVDLLPVRKSYTDEFFFIRVQPLSRTHPRRLEISTQTLFEDDVIF